MATKCEMIASELLGRRRCSGGVTASQRIRENQYNKDNIVL